ncbi:hypothetical protein MBLNU457_1151t1 [Dothideomycetes sp. NU457]
MDSTTASTRTCSGCKYVGPASEFLKDNKFLNTCQVCRSKSAASYHKAKAEKKVVQQQQDEILAQLRGNPIPIQHTDVDTLDCIYCHKSLPKSAFTRRSTGRVFKSCATCRARKESRRADLKSTRGAEQAQYGAILEHGTNSAEATGTVHYDESNSAEATGTIHHDEEQTIFGAEDFGTTPVGTAFDSVVPNQMSDLPPDIDPYNSISQQPFYTISADDNDEASNIHYIQPEIQSEMQPETQPQMQQYSMAPPPPAEIPEHRLLNGHGQQSTYPNISGAFQYPVSRVSRSNTHQTFYEAQAQLQPASQHQYLAEPEYFNAAPPQPEYLQAAALPAELDFQSEYLQAEQHLFEPDLQYEGVDWSQPVSEQEWQLDSLPAEMPVGLPEPLTTIDPAVLQQPYVPSSASMPPPGPIHRQRHWPLDMLTRPFVPAVVAEEEDEEGEEEEDDEGEEEASEEGEEDDNEETDFEALTRLEEQTAEQAEAGAISWPNNFEDNWEEFMNTY